MARYGTAAHLDMEWVEDWARKVNEDGALRCVGETDRTYYEENGEGIPMVCLHTAGTDGREWRHQLCDPDIAQSFRVIAFDLPRHGKSIPPGDFYKEEEEYKLTAKFY